MTQPPETTFVKKTETWFTLIEITEKQHSLGFDYFEAVFKYGTTKNNLFEHIVSNTVLDNAIKEISIILDCEITEKHYIIK